MKSPIFVTQPYLPPLEEFLPYLQSIWDSKILTNGGPLHQQLEEELCKFLGVAHISLFSSGTAALITALQALEITGEVITTPYSFVATAHSLVWNRNIPVFVDIEPDTLNIDPSKIEAAITTRTSAILPVHCYGNPCNVQKIQELASRNGIKVIYDACHAFGVEDKSGSLLQYGDLSCLSFHATKVFNTFEGGAIVSPNRTTKLKIDRLKNFGFVDEVTVVNAGLNGKMSEFNAAFGLLQLKHMEIIFQRRQGIDAAYRRGLSPIRGIHCLPQTAAKRNHSYFPIIVRDEYPLSRDELYNHLKDNGVNGRRYFYPLVSDFPIYKSFPSAQRHRLPNAANASDRVICLPIYPTLTQQEVDHIVNLIAEQA